MKAIRIIKCSDPSLLWYRDKVGDIVEYIREEVDVFWSREPAGYTNIIFRSDAEIVDITFTNNQILWMTEALRHYVGEGPKQKVIECMRKANG